VRLAGGPSDAAHSAGTYGLNFASIFRRASTAKF